MIKHIHITNFKSLGDVSVDLTPVTILIGRSGTGKSNFVEALRWLRDYLTYRDDHVIQEKHGAWELILPATAPRPFALSFTLTADAPGIVGDYQYTLKFARPKEQNSLNFIEERLALGNQVLFHQRQGQWVEPPALVSPPAPGQVMLGALTGVQEVTIAHLVLTGGIGCYAFPDNVLTHSNAAPRPGETGFADGGENFLQTFVAIHDNLQVWPHLRDMAAALRQLKSHLRSIDLQLPQRQQITVTHEVSGRLQVFNLRQESEGFRRLLACLLALYQTPPKQTLVFDEPEKGIYPPGLAILADEFKGYASKGHGQILLTTHSPELLDRFAPDEIRVVEMRDFTTHIGPVASDQLEALREHFLQPRELLTVDEARLERPAEAVAP